ncbi:DUF6650 family protein [Pectinatus frisingensis]|uniref:DUF6650 family protein n=1 Tax=Pectinatus frisingensis TaxID=865 RepID=UPI0015F6D547|nr:DUF6650 family protein [Pectinatus frisingensis]
MFCLAVAGRKENLKGIKFDSLYKRETTESHLKELCVVCNDFLNGLNSRQQPHIIYKNNNGNWADSDFSTLAEQKKKAKKSSAEDFLAFNFFDQLFVKKTIAKKAVFVNGIAVAAHNQGGILPILPGG